jgi:peptide deformylase
MKIINDRKKLENVKCKDIDITSKEEVQKVLKDAKKMIEILKENNGAGLSAIQVGIKKKFMIFNYKDDNFYIAVNPKYYADNTKKEIMIEKCLSYPNQEFVVKRWKRIRAVYYTITKDGEFKRIVAIMNKLYARIFQHETDHCHGKTINMIGEKLKDKGVKN